MKAIKKPVRLHYEIAALDHVVETLEGPVPARAGDMILTGTRGERWPITRERFEQTYVAEDVDLCWKKPLVVDVRQMDEPFQVTVGWTNAPLHGKPGDWLVTYGPGDHGVVDAGIFQETYELLDENHTV